MQPSFTHDSKSVSESELRDLDELVLWDPTNWIDLIIRYSEHPQLSISGAEAMTQRYRCWRRGGTLYIQHGGNLFDRVVDAFTTILTRKKVKVELSIDSLERVKATGMVEVDLAAWRGTEPEVHLFGPAVLWGGQFPVMKR